MKHMRRLSTVIKALLPILATLGGCIEGKRLDEQSLRIIYGDPLPAVEAPLQVFHLGHSLVGPDMPAFLAQLAGPEHGFHSQLGWGTTLRAHWEPEVPIKGFDESNRGDAYRDFREATAAQNYDAFVLTEMVEIKSAIRYHDSAKYLARIVDHIRRESPGSLVYFYESWHEYHDAASWLDRLDRDYERYWLSRVVDAAMAQAEEHGPIYLIPVGQVMHALFMALQEQGPVAGLTGPESIFAVLEDGALDTIHLNDLGNYLVAVVHFAVLYRQNPLGLPILVNDASGEPASGLTLEAAQLIQRITWEVVCGDFRTGLPRKHNSSAETDTLDPGRK
jgi:hypothetical protein